MSVPFTDTHSLVYTLTKTMRTIVALVLVFLCMGFTHGCHTFHNVSLTVVTSTGEKYATVLDTCMERKAFGEGTTITEVYVEKQKIPRLYSDAIRHMTKLLVLKFNECQIEVVEVALFRNVPRLKIVRMTRNRIEEVPNGVFTSLEELQVLDLRGNRIKSIESGAFGNLQTLKDLNLGYNQLEVWSAEWLEGTTNLEVMDMQNNKITVVPRRAFSSFPRLKKICFDYNDLEVIHPEAFVGLTRLRFLGLRHNKLKSLNPRSFPNSIQIEKMMIDANHLNYLSGMLLAKLEVRELCVFGNPWKCPCLDQIYNWLYSTNGTVITPDFCKNENLPVCSSPSTYSDTCQEVVDEQLTKDYLGQLKLANPPLNDKCARLS